MTTDVDEFFSDTTPPVDPLRDELIAMIRARDAATPRHLQKELGPSEVSHPCMRRMALGMMDEPRCNPQYDPLPSIIGTATHRWLESAATHANNQLGWQRWLVETRVNVAPGLSGSCDLYDKQTATVVDWKILGDNRFKMFSKEMSPTYRLQSLFYGRGFINAGLPVERVAVAILPRGGTLTKMHLWSIPYDADEAARGLRKRDAVIALLDEFRVEIDPSRYAWIPITPYDCIFCPWFSPNPKSPIQCGGKE